MTVTPAEVATWCSCNLGSTPAKVHWTRGHLSTVIALQLADGRDVVVKARPDSPRLGMCHVVHGILWHRGFPCPEPLTLLSPLGDEMANAEAYMPGGRPGRHEDPWLAAETAKELCRLIAMCPPVDQLPTLAPPPPWTGWIDPRADPWPPPDEGPSLSHHPATQHLVPLARSLNEMLRASNLPLVVGHSDWYQGNLRWEDGKLFAADDWDSIAALPEAAFAGCSAVLHLPAPAGRDPGYPSAGVDETARFLHLYGEARGRHLSPEELRVAWGAGLWLRVFDAAKFLAAGSPDKAAYQIRDVVELRRLAGI